MHRKIELSKVIIGVFTIILVISLVFIVFKFIDKKDAGVSYELDQDVKFEGKTYKRNVGVDAYLIVGLDKYVGQMDNDSYYNDHCADFILLLAIDYENEKIVAIQINRDTMCDVDVLGVAGSKIKTKTCQISLSHCYGSGDLVSLRNTSDSVSKLLGVEIKSYMAVTMDAISAMTDYVGGVPVVIEDDFTGVEDSWKIGDTLNLNGSNAVKYVQSRSAMIEPTNVARMARQRNFINSLIERLRAANEKNDDFAMDLYMKMADYICFNDSETQVKKLIDKVINYEFTGIISIDGELKEGEQFMEFWPDMTDLHRKAINSFYKIKK